MPGDSATRQEIKDFKEEALARFKRSDDNQQRLETKIDQILQKQTEANGKIASAIKDIAQRKIDLEEHPGNCEAVKAYKNNAVPFSQWKIAIGCAIITILSSTITYFLSMIRFGIKP